MAMAITLREYLTQTRVPYDVVSHPYTSNSMQTAEVAHIPGDQLAKSIVLEDEKGYLMVVVPATHRIDLNRLQQQFNRHFEFATEEEVADLFDDCDLGAIPPIGEAYGIDVLLDDSLAMSPEIYFEAGDHTELIHLDGEDFLLLMAGAKHGQVSQHI